MALIDDAARDPDVPKGLFAVTDKVIVDRNTAFNDPDVKTVLEKYTKLDKAPALDPEMTRLKLDSVPGVRAVDPV
jgi:hypothetical protein